jgi:hypothetical protein
MKTIKTLLATVSFIALAHTPAQAFCGFYTGKAEGAKLFNETSQVVLVRDGKRTVLSMRNDYKGPLKEFVLVVPTPTVLEKGQVHIADQRTFERLDAWSSPRLVEYYDADPCRSILLWAEDLFPSHPGGEDLYFLVHPRGVEDRAPAHSQALGVTVEARYQLEEYDIVSLSATQSDGLETWLRENGYAVPKGASAALLPYIRQGMKFFVAKVNLKEQAKTGTTTLRPLQFAFESEKFMLPLRLGMLNAPPGKSQDLIVYVLTREGRVESSNYRTLKMPANIHLPPFIKPRFTDFYKALFDKQADKERQRVVFTEYFWDMRGCDPCADDPLSKQELRDAGVFWQDGNADLQFDVLRGASGSAWRASIMPPRGAADSNPQPVLLTRLHVRYSANSFPEDLMFSQTRDNENWQASYVTRRPHEGAVADCSQEMKHANCDGRCTERVKMVLSAVRTEPHEGALLNYLGKSPAELRSEFLASCAAAVQEGVKAAARYYQQRLPARQGAEKQTLAEVTGWSPARIAQLEHMPALPPSKTSGEAALVDPAPVDPAPVKPVSSWWRRLLGREDQP